MIFHLRIVLVYIIIQLSLDLFVFPKYIRVERFHQSQLHICSETIDELNP